jgi:hypothetical protein
VNEYNLWGIEKKASTSSGLFIGLDTAAVCWCQFGSCGEVSFRDITISEWMRVALDQFEDLERGKLNQQTNLAILSVFGNAVISFHVIKALRSGRSSMDHKSEGFQISMPNFDSNNRGEMKFLSHPARALFSGIQERPYIEGDDLLLFACCTSLL